MENKERLSGEAQILLINNFMEVRNILSIKQTRQRDTSGSIGSICGNNSNDLNSVNCINTDNRATANAIDCDTINQISFTGFLPCANITGKENKECKVQYRVNPTIQLQSRYPEGYRVGAVD